MEKEFSASNSEFGDLLSASKLDADEKENLLLFGSIRNTEKSFSIGVGASQVPERFFFPPNDSLFTSEVTAQSIAHNHIASADRLASLASNLSSVPRIDEIAEFLKSSRLQSTRSVAESPMKDFLISNIEEEEQKPARYECTQKVISWPSVRVGDSFIQYCSLKHLSNSTETVTLKFSHRCCQENSFQFVFNNQMTKELTMKLGPAAVLRFGILFLPLDIGKVLSYIELESESDGSRIKLIDLYGYAGEVIFRPNLPFNPDQRTPELIFTSKENYCSFKITNYGDVMLFFIFDKVLAKENLFNITVRPKKGRILPKESSEIVITIHNPENNIDSIVNGNNDSLVKISHLNVIYGVHSDMLRIVRLYKEFNSSCPEIFASRTNELKLISSEMEFFGTDISLINDLSENFHTLYKHGMKHLSIDIVAVRSSFYDDIAMIR